MYNIPMQQRHQMTHQFSEVPSATIPRSSFDRTHGHKTTFDAGYLVPFFVDEALPGDTFSVNATLFARMSTPIFPIMDNIVMDVHYFAVPLRLVWDNFKKFMGEQNNPGDSTDYVIPQLVAPVGGWSVGSISDYFGIPTGVAGLSHSALFHRAYNLIFNEWFRDQNLQNSLTVSKGDGPDSASNYTLQRRNKRHDYFTSSLPWPQKGAAVSIPLGTSAPVATYAPNGQPLGVREQGTANIHLMDSSGASTTMGTTSGAAYQIFADLSQATAATINSLRQAFQIQKMYERDARGGTRYTEIILSHFGVKSPDARLQRPEYLGGGSIPVNVSPIPNQTVLQSEVIQGAPVGTLAGIASAAGANGFTWSATEHCILMGFVSTRADLTYQQGLNRMFSRRTKYDYYWPALSSIGEQAVLRKELYAVGNSNDDIVFGYQERYAEYRYKPSLVTGKFRSSISGTLDPWHLSQYFSSPPTLSSAFIAEDPPMSRVLAVTDEPHFIMDSFIRMRCVRPMPVYGVPGLIDHF